MIPGFPNLIKGKNYEETSLATPNYNCIAWAAGDDENWWEPDPFGMFYWPPDVPRDYSIAAYVAAYESRGFLRCENHHLEEGFEKVAIYALGDSPTHAARQLPDGRWTSKMGEWIDIAHDDLVVVEGPKYGEPKIFMKRATIP